MKTYFFSEDKTLFNIEDDYKIESSDVNYRINEAEIFSNKKTNGFFKSHLRYICK